MSPLSFSLVRRVRRTARGHDLLLADEGEFRYEISGIMPIPFCSSFLFLFFLVVETLRGRRLHVMPTRDLTSCTMLYLFLRIFFCPRESLHGRRFVLIIEIISRDSRETTLFFPDRIFAC